MSENCQYSFGTLLMSGTSPLTLVARQAIVDEFDCSWKILDPLALQAFWKANVFTNNIMDL